VAQETIDLGHLALPSSGAPVPGVVLIHDVWGLYDHFRELANRLAGHGFAALAIDLYRRRGAGVKIEDPGAWIRALDDREVLRDVQSAVDALHQHPAVRAPRVGVTGFCMGGMYALLAGAASERVSATAPFYGLLSEEHGLLRGESGPDRALKPLSPLDAGERLRCPLLGFFGEQDEFVPPSDVAALRERIDRSGQPAECRS
jgi:carboxymethylenebutenolidase